MSLKIDFYCHPGSPSFRFTPADVFGRGLGGAELSLVSLTAALAARGHRVSVYNDLTVPERVWDGVQYRHASDFDPMGNRDAFVLFRNPYPSIRHVRGRRIFWSTDQVTTRDYHITIYPYVKMAVAISLFHKHDHMARYNVPHEKIEVIDLGVRVDDYAQPRKKTPGQIIFSSVPDRGAQFIPFVWPLIKEAVPQATLVITGDYGLWGDGVADARPLWVPLLSALPDVYYPGRVNRKDLVRHQLESQVFMYPHRPVGNYPELFCVSLAEAMVAGCVPVVTDVGGLSTTLIHGAVIKGDIQERYVQQAFAGAVIEALAKAEKTDLPTAIQEKARKRFSWQNSIVQKWESVLG